jgi:type IV pilus assembly protein PilQ
MGCLRHFFRKALACGVVPNLLCGIGIVAAGLLGCSTPRIMMEPEKAQPPRAAAQPLTKAPEPVAPQPAAPPLKEAAIEEPSFKLQDMAVLEAGGQTTIKIKLSDAVNQYRHFVLTQPSRIVLDIFGPAKRNAQVENFRAETHWLSMLRVSSGEGYLRVVMEVAAASAPPYTIDPETGGLKIVLGPVNPQHTAKKELQIVQNGKRADVVGAEPKSGTAPGAASPVADAQAKAEKSYSGQRISLDFKDADIKNVFRLLAEVSGLNIVVTGEVQRKVTVRLIDVPWDQALDLLIDTNGLGKEQVGNVVRISTADTLKGEREKLAAAKKAEENLEPLQTAYFNINYGKVKEMVEKIKPVLSPRGVVLSDERSNTIIVRDIKKGIEEANGIASRLDTRTPQVLIESNLVEATPTFSRALGMKLDFSRSADIKSAFPADPTVTGGAAPFIKIFQNRFGPLSDLTAELTAAEKEGDIRIISRPSVVTLNNVSSTIQSLRILRITLPSGTSNVASGTGSSAGSSVATEKIPVGIILTVTPQISSDGFVLMNISVKSSSITVVPSVPIGVGGSGTAPFEELSREAISNVLVRDGETIVIGGILKDTKSTSESGIPWLKDVPVIGWFFKNMKWQKDYEELIVFITPRVISAGSQNLPTAEQLWRDRMLQTQGG